MAAYSATHFALCNDFRSRCMCAESVRIKRYFHHSLRDGFGRNNALVQIAGCTILGFGIAMEVKCGSVTMPGEGISIAIHKVTGWPFPKAKIRVDITLVVLAVVFCFLLLGSWKWEIVGIETLFAMIYVGVTVRLFNKHLAWFERLLHYRPGCRRYVYGLAKYIRRQI